MVLTLLLVASFIPGQAAQTTAAECIRSGADPAMLQLCLGEEATKRGEGAAAESVERRRHYDAAADHYRRAADLAPSEVKIADLAALAHVYDTGRLSDPGQREVVLRELIALVPADPRFAFDLASLQESQGFTDSAEDSLLGARQRHPTDVEPYKQLAQFYARRATALSTSVREQTPKPQNSPGEPDDKGIYRVGGQLAPPVTLGVPQYPDEAKAAGIQGTVAAEIVIDPKDVVTDARIVRSIPLLDDAALKAVHQWRYEPAIVKGQAVPVRMVVTVSFTLPK